MTNKSTYTASAIEVLSGLEPVQKRPGMLETPLLYFDSSENKIFTLLVCMNHHLDRELLDYVIEHGK
jgi:DNA gyrase/topoisomerase IV subunit B